jgi:PAS domain S-box-containing protein
LPAAGFGKRGVTAAEALASELHREIGLREDLERRLRAAEERLAVRAAASAPAGEASPPRPPGMPPEPPVFVRRTPPPEAPEQPLAEAMARRQQAEERQAQAEARAREAEERLRAVQQRLDLITSGSVAGYYEQDLATGRAFYSEGCRQMLGYSLAEMPDTCQAFSDLVHPDDVHSDWLAERTPLGAGKNRFVRAFRLRRRDGGYCWMESAGQELTDAAGKTLRIVACMRDISDRKTIEERLHQSEERFHLLTLSSPLGFFDADLVTGRSYYSPMWKSMLGYQPEELPDSQQTWLDLVHPEDRQGAVAAHAQRNIGESRRPFSHVLRLRHKAGHHVRVHASGVDFFAPDGRLLRTLGVHADVDGLKTAAAALAHEKEFLASLLDSLAEGIVTADSSGKVTYLNASARALCGLSGAEAMGLPVEGFYRRIGAQARRQADNPVRAALATGRRAVGPDPVNLRAEGLPERIVGDHAAPILNAAGAVEGAVLMLQEINEVHGTTEEVLKAGQLESLGVLAGGIAHDFNNLLTAMLGNLSVARFAGGLPGHAVDALDRAERACWRARDLTGQLLTFARGGDPVRAPLALLPTVEQSIRGVLKEHPNIRFELAPAEPLPTIEADKAQLEQAIAHITLNAVQAMPDGGTLRAAVRLVTSPGGPPGLERAGQGAGAYVEVALTDTGIGIAPENLAKIFDPFFSTRPNGTGLGLAMAYSIVRKHDGHLRVESRLGEGSSFTLYLPVSPQAMPPLREALGGTAGASTSRVLFMDDDADILELAGAVLRLLDYDPVLTRDGNEAIDAYQEARAAGRPFAAVILDLTIPGGMGGRDTIRRLREIDPDVRAIVSSGYSNDAVLSEHRAHGFRAMVAKPYRMEDLARALSEAIGVQPPRA